MTEGLQGSAPRGVDVSVVIPTRNRVHFLRDAVASVLSQGDVTCEAIIVDDASDDGTQEWAQSLKLQSDRVRYYRLDPRRERSAARNHGLANAVGEFVIFLDDDDRLRPHSLHRLSKPMKRDLKLVAAVGARIVVDAGGRRRRYQHPRFPVCREVLPELLARWIPGNGQVLMRRATLTELGGYREDLMGPEEYELYLRLSTLGPFQVIPFAVLEYRVHAGQERPRDTIEVENTYKREFVESLEGSMRSRADRSMRFKDVRTAAQIAFQRERYGDAFSLYLESIRTDPELALSPLLLASSLKLAARILLGIAMGPRGVARTGRLIAQIKSRLKLDPGQGSTKKIVDRSATEMSDS